MDTSNYSQVSLKLWLQIVGNPTCSILLHSIDIRVLNLQSMQGCLQRICSTMSFPLTKLCKTKPLQSSVPPIVSAMTRSEADALTTLSTLSQSINNRSGPRVAPADSHPLIMCTDEVGHEVRGIGGTRSGKRRKRGKCSECGRNTRYYCFTCPPSGQRKHEWCCPDDTSANKRMCHTKHKENRQTTA